MQDVHSQALQLQTELDLALEKLKFHELDMQRISLESEAAKPDFWSVYAYDYIVIVVWP